MLHLTKVKKDTAFRPKSSWPTRSQRSASFVVSEEQTLIHWNKLGFLPLLLSLYVNKDTLHVCNISPPVYREDLCEGSDTHDQITMTVDTDSIVFALLHGQNDELKAHIFFCGGYSGFGNATPVIQTACNQFLFCFAVLVKAQEPQWILHQNAEL